MRINKFIASAGICARRAADDLIRQGRVKVNHVRVTEPGMDVQENDIVMVDDSPIKPAERKYYIMLNKPDGYVTTVHDQFDRASVTELVTDIEARLFPVGRLDYHTEGLLLMTNDGDFANSMMHPRYEVEKEYLVKLNRPIVIDDLNKALDGIYIDLPTPYRIKRYDLIPRTKTFIKVTLTEGKNREIRKIFNYLDYDVKSLTRIRIGCVELGDLEVGEWRNLKSEEINGLLTGRKNSKEVSPKKTRKVIRVKKADIKGVN